MDLGEGPRGRESQMEEKLYGKRQKTAAPPPPPQLKVWICHCLKFPLWKKKMIGNFLALNFGKYPYFEEFFLNVLLKSKYGRVIFLLMVLVCCGGSTFQLLTKGIDLYTGPLSESRSTLFQGRVWVCSLVLSPWI